ncbi:MAG: GDSL-type esterase/lipase family protein [Armatimonas sp.]
MQHESPDPNQRHAREWPSTLYSDEALAAPPHPDTACTIALLGDCTVACTYFPPANRPENHLAVRLRRAFPGQPILVHNLAADGESADGFLRPERWEKALGEISRLDIAFIRYGINDRKRFGISGCLQNLRLLCEALKEHSPDVHLFLETSIWVDYPTHYLWDRNAALGPVYEAMRVFVQEEGYPIVDIYANMEAETKRGNWDLRVRGLPAPQHTIIDDSFDALFGDDPAFFTNIHPNSRCLGLIAEWEIEALKQQFGTMLPWP